MAAFLLFFFTLLEEWGIPLATRRSAVQHLVQGTPGPAWSQCPLLQGHRKNTVLHVDSRAPGDLR